MTSINAGRPTQWIAPAAGLLLALPISASPARVHEEVIYILTGGGQWLITYDPETLVRGPLHDCAFKLSGIYGLFGLTYAGGRLYSVDMNWEILPDRFVEIHPSNGDPVVPGFTGQSQTTNWTLDFNPVDGRLYGIESYTNLVEIDPSTGAASFLTKLSGRDFAVLGATSLAIDPTGRAVVVHDAAIPGGNVFGHLDLRTGVVEPVGRTAIGIGRFWDLAFDSKGVLWGIFNDYFDPTRNGLYQIFLDDLSFKKVLDVPPVGISWQSIAFGPAPQVNNYCAGSPSSRGCTPAITSVGLPSPTAPSGFEVRAADVPSGALGVLVWGTGDTAQIPFGGGTLCIDGRLSASAPTSAGGSAPPGIDCRGEWSADLNALLYARAPLPPGTTVRCQWLGRDPSSGFPSPLVMSNALELVLAP